MYSMNEVVRSISEEPVIFPIKKDIFPKTLNDVGFDLRRKGITFPKRVVSNTFYRIWNVDAFEGNTSLKRSIPNPCYCIRDVYVSERITT